MENEEDYMSEDSSEDIEGNQEKNRLVVISSYNDMIKTHTNAALLRNLKIEEIVLAPTHLKFAKANY